MSLLIHYPCVREFETNRGLDFELDISFLNENLDGNPTLESNGKIGKCKRIRFIQFQLDQFELTKFFTCFWYKPNANVTIYGLLISANTWTHIGIYYSGSSVLMYINGVKTGSVVSNISKYEIANFKIDLSGYLNDFRIYDDELSIKLIKDISKGLVAWWKLDEQLVTNLIPVEDLGLEFTATSDDSVDTPIKRWSDIIILNSSDEYTVTFEAKGTRPFCCYLYSSGLQIVHIAKTKIYGQENLDNTREDGRAKIVPSNSYKRYTIVRKATISENSSSKHLLFRLDSGASGTVSIRNVVFYKGDENVFSDSRVIYDSSGNDYNTEAPAGITTVFTDVKKYNTCINIPSDVQLTWNNIFLPLNQSFTITAWVKYNLIAATLFWLGSATNSNSMNCGLNAAAADLFVIFGSSGYGGIQRGPTLTYASENWNFYCLVYNKEASGTSSNPKYILRINDNVEKTNASGSTTSTASSYYLRLQKSTLSDVRIYSTALSEEDIQEIYKTSTLIDSKTVNGITYSNILTGELVENGTVTSNVMSGSVNITSKNLLEAAFFDEGDIETANNPYTTTVANIWGDLSNISGTKHTTPILSTSGTTTDVNVNKVIDAYGINEID